MVSLETHDENGIQFKCCYSFGYAQNISKKHRLVGYSTDHKKILAQRKSSLCNSILLSLPILENKKKICLSIKVTLALQFCNDFFSRKLAGKVSPPHYQTEKTSASQ